MSDYLTEGEAGVRVLAPLLSQATQPQAVQPVQKPANQSAFQFLQRISPARQMLVLLPVIALSSSQSPSSLSFAAFPAAFAALLDAARSLYWKKPLRFPENSLISGLFIGMILTPGNYFAASLAVLFMFFGKTFLRRNAAFPFFNPAAFGLVSANLLTGLGNAWWAASSWAVLPLGVFNAFKNRKLPLEFSFLAVHAALISAVYSTQEPSLEFLFTAAFGVTNAFFAFFMLLEPKTSPHPFKSQVVHGTLVALLAVAVLEAA